VNGLKGIVNNIEMGLIYIMGDTIARANIVRDRFPHLSDVEVVWVVDNFDMIATYSVFEYDMGGRIHRVMTNPRRVSLPKPIFKDDADTVNIIYSLEHPPAVIAGVTTYANSVVTMASVKDPDLKARLRAEKISELLNRKE
jgi:hypothetical protein